MITVLKTTAIALALCGDPVICRALVLILRGPDYDVVHVPTASLGTPGSLAGVQAVLLASERDHERRRVILELLKEAIGTEEVQVLELSAAFESRPDPDIEHAWSNRKIPWPCSTEELKRHIAVAFADKLPTGGATNHTDREGLGGLRNEQEPA